jgi:uncharacterized protein
MGRADRGATIRVSVAYSPQAGQVDLVELDMPEAGTVGEALALSGLLERFPALDLSQHRLGVWGRLAAADEGLLDRDRVEIYRPLNIDPKEARRLRYKQHRDRQARIKPR